MNMWGNVYMVEIYIEGTDAVTKGQLATNNDSLLLCEKCVHALAVYVGKVDRYLTVCVSVKSVWFCSR